jgi:hypothetical protein
MRATGVARHALALMLFTALIAAGCSAGEDSSGEGSPAPGDRRSICQTNADLLIGAVENLPDQVDEAAIIDVAGIHRESSDNLLANDCDLEVIDRVDATLCQYLSATPAGDTINQEVLDATAAVYCEDPTGRPDATTTMPPDPAINAGDER